MMLFLPDADYETNPWEGGEAAQSSDKSRSRAAKAKLAPVPSAEEEPRSDEFDLLGPPDPSAAPCKVEQHHEQHVEQQPTASLRRRRRARASRVDLSVARTRAADRSRGSSQR